jgi:hypothetical protein
MAAEPGLKKLNGWVPDAKELDAYLAEVRVLLSDMSDKVAAKSKLAEEYKPISTARSSLPLDGRKAAGANI